MSGQVIKNLILFSILSLIFVSVECSRIPYIIGGDEVDDIENFQFQLSMRHLQSHVCGASVIHCHWALTAAHCLENNIIPEWISFRGGSINRLEGGHIFNAEQYFIHPQYEPLTYDFDVAVVRTIEKMTGENVHTIPLIAMSEFLEPNQMGRISGWGLTEEGEYPEILRTLELQIWDQQTCFIKWYEEITSNMFCAGGEIGFDSCRGDSGGPMTVNGVQVGVVSAGTMACGINFPGVYTNLTHPSIRSFIKVRTGV